MSTDGGLPVPEQARPSGGGKQRPKAASGPQTPERQEVDQSEREDRHPGKPEQRGEQK